MKICPKCNIQKEHPQDFSKGSKKKDGSYSYRYCKDCINKYQRNYKLTNGKVKIPHGTPKNNLVNTTFNKLTVVEYMGQEVFNSRKRHVWLCQCECGNKKAVEETNLKSNSTKSCGCLMGQYNTGHKEISGTIWYNIEYKANKRNIEFNITIEYAWDLFIKQNRQCSLSGLDIYFPKKYRDECTASLDRINSSIGYIQNNIQWVHKNINMMKWTFSQKDFLNYCTLIHQHNK